MDSGGLNAANYTHGANPEKESRNIGSRNDFLLKRAPLAQKRGEGEKVHSIRMQVCARKCQEGLPRVKQRGTPRLENVPSDNNLFQVKSNGLQKCAGNHKRFVVFGVGNYSVIRPYA